MGEVNPRYRPGPEAHTVSPQCSVWALKPPPCMQMPLPLSRARPPRPLTLPFVNKAGDGVGQASLQLHAAVASLFVSIGQRPV